MQLILASTSPYRKQLLERLQLPFISISSDFKERTANDPINTEKAVQFNSMGKAQTVLKQHPKARIIASDQLAICDNITLGKPGSFDAAYTQLASTSGKVVTFITGLAVIDAHSQHYEMVPFDVKIRALSDQEIEHYLHTEQPFDCAGSFKSEGLGVSLFEYMRGDDPTALIGLPLIALSNILQPLQGTSPKHTSQR